ncbi:MAG: class 1 fructose-bisphosphatase [Candidatus Eisenbacteria sp.]|nr:class 1 fructose-bisphosphatase [Candidatus Eisenbacteria bacterium]
MARSESTIENNSQTRLGISFSEHVADQQHRLSPAARGDLSSLLRHIMLAAKIISRETRKAALVDILGLTGKINVQGEEVQKLDDYADDVMIRNLRYTGHLCAMSSEEHEDIIRIPERYAVGNYTLTFDPLDGSSNIDANVGVGTIFSIHRRISSGPTGTHQDILQRGKNQVCAGYIIYGPSTILVYTTGHGVHGFTLDPSVGEFLLSHPDIKTPEEGNIYSVNEGNYYNWDETARQVIEAFKSGKNYRGKAYTSRYVGSLVSDFHRNLLYGGIFLYPADNKNTSGKLRLLPEANPLGFVVENAGGLASTGTQRILDIEPKRLHHRVPLIIGSRKDVEFVESIFAAAKEKDAS